MPSPSTPESRVPAPGAHRKDRLLRWILAAVAATLVALLAALIAWQSPPRPEAPTPQPVQRQSQPQAQSQQNAQPQPQPQQAQPQAKSQVRPPVPPQVPTQVQPPVPAPMQAQALTRSLPVAISPPQAASAALLTLPELLAGHSADWRAVRLRENPLVLAIEFPSLAAQGAAMNRVAALLEKADAPRDRVLTDRELAALIARAGDNAQTFYQGHDYDGEGLARFFAQVRKQGLALNPPEERLRRTLLDHGLLAETATGLRPQGTQAVISFTSTQADDPTTPADETVDERRRDSVLRHEYSHGRFFTRPAYREHCRRFWREILNEPQREAMRRFLAGIGYDRSNEELMLNETQALLMHTPDTRAFNAQAVGWTEATLADLRSRFWRSLPADADDSAGGRPPAGR